MEISADTIRAIRTLCDEVMKRDGYQAPLTIRAMTILSALDIQERTQHGAANPPG